MAGLFITEVLVSEIALAAPPPAVTAGLTFEVAPAAGRDLPLPGRVFVVLSPHATPQPRTSLETSDKDVPATLAADVADLAPERPARLGNEAAAFPIASLARLTPGTYHVQAVLDVSRDIRGSMPPGISSARPARSGSTPPGARRSGSSSITRSRPRRSRRTRSECGI